MITINSLKEKGYKVYVSHKRYFCEQVFNKNMEPVQAYVLRNMSQVDRDIKKNAHPVGGMTCVSIVSPDGDVKTGCAQCCLKDNYNKKLGVQIALNRIFTHLE